MKAIDPKLVRRKYVLARRLGNGLATLDLVYELWERYHDRRGFEGHKTIKRVYERQTNGLGKRYKTKREALNNIPEHLRFKNAKIYST